MRDSACSVILGRNEFSHGLGSSLARELIQATAYSHLGNITIFDGDVCFWNTSQITDSGDFAAEVNTDRHNSLCIGQKLEL